MKRLIGIISTVAILSLLNGCQSTETSEDPEVNSGVLDESYVGDADPELEENYKQTEEESKIQDEILEKIEEKDKTDEREVNDRL